MRHCTWRPRCPTTHNEHEFRRVWATTGPHDQTNEAAASWRPPAAARPLPPQGRRGVGPSWRRMDELALTCPFAEPWAMSRASPSSTDFGAAGELFGHPVATSVNAIATRSSAKLSTRSLEKRSAASSTRISRGRTRLGLEWWCGAAGRRLAAPLSGSATGQSRWAHPDLLPCVHSGLRRIPIY